MINRPRHMEHRDACIVPSFRRFRVGFGHDLALRCCKPATTSEDDAGVIQVPMRLATCAEVPPAYLEDAMLHGDCPSGVSETIAGDADDDSVFEPAGTVPGNCGTSTLWAWNNGGGYAGFYLAATSTRGTIMRVRYDVHWENTTKGISDSFGGTEWPWSSSWSRTASRFTWTGWVYAYMTGYVVTPIAICTFLNPSD